MCLHFIEEIPQVSHLPGQLLNLRSEVLDVATSHDVIEHHQLIINGLEHLLVVSQDNSLFALAALHKAELSDL